MTLRLHKYMAECGVASRRRSEELIQEGRVRLNGNIVTELGVQIDPEKDRVDVDGKRIRRERKVYVMLNKPRDCITTASDDLDRRTVVDLVEGVDERIVPVGRLDRDSEGLLVLTNDGDLSLYLTHPRYGVTKTYQVTAEGFVRDETLDRLRSGVNVEAKKIVPASVRLLERGERESRLVIEVTEGVNREVRRICAAVGHEVQRLKRLRVGPLILGNLPRGRARLLTRTELDQLRRGMEAHGFEMDSPTASPKRDARSGGPPRKKRSGPGAKKSARDASGPSGKRSRKGKTTGKRSNRKEDERGGEPDRKGGARKSKKRKGDKGQGDKRQGDKGQGDGPRSGRGKGGRGGSGKGRAGGSRPSGGGSGGGGGKKRGRGST